MNTKPKIIYDSVHGLIELPPICMQLIDTSEYQRLRGIHQLGTCYYVFTGATHKRFEHSIGVSYLAAEWIKNIKNNQPDLNIDDEKIELLQIAGLCHDLGHGPFSHIFDNEFLPKYVSKNNPLSEHENRSCLIFEKIVKKYNINLSQEKIDIVKDLIEPKKFIVEPKWLYQIVSNCINGIDVDKFDYIQRDTKQIGLCYGFDFQSLFKLTRIIDNNICFPLKMIFEINNLFQTRYRLHNEIYNHPVVKSIEYMIIDILDLCENEMKISNTVLCENSWEEFCKLDDHILNHIEKIESNCENLIKAKELVLKIRTRKLYKYVGEINLKIPIQLDNLQDIISWINTYEKYQVHNLSNDDLIIHNLDLSYHFNPFDHVKFYNQSTMEINKISKDDYCNIRPINDKKIRIFCRNPEKKKEIMELINKFKKIYDKLCNSQSF